MAVCELHKTKNGHKLTVMEAEGDRNGGQARRHREPLRYALLKSAKPLLMVVQPPLLLSTMNDSLADRASATQQEKDHTVHWETHFDFFWKSDVSTSQGGIKT